MVVITKKQDKEMKKLNKTLELFGIKDLKIVVETICAVEKKVTELEKKLENLENEVDKIEGCKSILEEAKTMIDNATKIIKKDTEEANSKNKELRDFLSTQEVLG